jgi:DNA-directed RNA polymerase subunit RPC12/RpoP
MDVHVMDATPYTDYRCDRCGQPCRIFTTPELPQKNRCGVPGCNGSLREIELEMDDR